jgi:hypothetical protein
MKTITLTEQELENILSKTVRKTIVNLLDEKLDDIKKLRETIEDIGLGQAMIQGRTGEYVDKNTIYNILDGKQ